LLRGCSADDEVRTFYTYAIQIFHVDHVFGKKRQGWNQKYEAAIKIYGPGPASAIIRSTIKTLHKDLYKSRLTQHSIKGYLHSGKDFLELINNGWGGGKPRMFTYALMPTHLFFSETGASFFQDFTSKHAMHANASREVVYAGEFHIRLQKGKYKLVIDNNSGTFSPNKGDLPFLKEVMELNFPDMEVEVLDYKDDLLHTSRKDMLDKDEAQTKSS